MHPEVPGIPLHLVLRSRRGAACFAGPQERAAWLEQLRRGAARHGCAVHAYALMGNHVHLLATPARAGACAALLAAPGRAPAWEPGYQATPVLARRYLLACMRYIELNPVRAGLVRRPESWRWSSYRANALGEPDALLTPHPLYCALGRGADERRAAYRASFRGR